MKYSAPGYDLRMQLASVERSLAGAEEGRLRNNLLRERRNLLESLGEKATRYKRPKGDDSGKS